ncbi:hypothetical protein DFH27DRAFT_189437 [Peziza echinospora]|nr:hypothetical protein DFH27DRAFT_189437 [Peziza echinospora]
MTGTWRPYSGWCLMEMTSKTRRGIIGLELSMAIQASMPSSLQSAPVSHVDHSTERAREREGAVQESEGILVSAKRRLGCEVAWFWGGNEGCSVSLKILKRQDHTAEMVRAMDRSTGLGGGRHTQVGILVGENHHSIRCNLVKLHHPTVRKSREMCRRKGTHVEGDFVFVGNHVAGVSGALVAVNDILLGVAIVMLWHSGGHHAVHAAGHGGNHGHGHLGLVLLVVELVDKVARGSIGKGKGRDEEGNGVHCEGAGKLEMEEIGKFAGCAEKASREDEADDGGDGEREKNWRGGAGGFILGASRPRAITDNLKQSLCWEAHHREPPLQHVLAEQRRA